MPAATYALLLCEALEGASTIAISPHKAPPVSDHAADSARLRQAAREVLRRALGRDALLGRVGH